MERPDYPALYNAANQASIDSQKHYLSAIKWIIILTILAAILSVYAEESKELGITAALLFLAVLFLTILQGHKRYDKLWYNGRAVAESVKTRTWRFIMRAEPYQDATKIQDVKRDFCQDLNDILSSNLELGDLLTHPSMTEDTISESMVKIRNYDITDRLNYYISNRINEQRAWYYSKASENKRLAMNWFYGLIGTQAVIIILLFIEIGYDIYYLPTTAIIVVGNSILSWMQLKRYQDLATSYALTAHEIGILKEQSVEVHSESTLSDFVKDSENAFSREHTQWVARKDKP